jgi:WXG100 family type VII secretion target
MSGGPDGLLVQHAALEQIQADLGRAVLRIHDRLDRLDADLLPLRTDFDGHARAAYDAGKARWDAAIREMQELLAAAGRQVGEANAEFARVDDLAASRLDQAF